MMKIFNNVPCFVMLSKPVKIAEMSEKNGYLKVIYCENKKSELMLRPFFKKISQF